MARQDPWGTNTEGGPGQPDNVSLHQQRTLNAEDLKKSYSYCKQRASALVSLIMIVPIYIGYPLIQRNDSFFNKCVFVVSANIITHLYIKFAMCIYSSTIYLKNTC